MKIELHEIPQMTIYEFAEAHDLTMEVRERRYPVCDPARYYASFKGVEIMKDCFLVGMFGNGRTPEEAITNYAKEISLQRLVFDPFRKSRREIAVPRLT